MSLPLIKPFRGILYNATKIDSIEPCVCPPYDVISNIRTYYERSPVNAIRLELPMPEPSLDKYSAARKTLDEWLKNKIILPDDHDTIYVYLQEFTVDGISYTRKGFIPAVHLDRSRIRTHESTKKKAKQDRERLITTLEACTSFVFSLYEDKDKKIDTLLTQCEKEEIYNFTDEQDIKNSFFRITDRGAMENLSQLMDQKDLYIADGHHRFNVSCKLGLPYVPMYLTDMHSDGIVILPYHRIIKWKADRGLDDILQPIRNYGDIAKYSVDTEGSFTTTLDRIKSSANPTFSFFSKHDPSSLYVFTLSRPIPMDDSIKGSLQKLNVSILHNGILRGLLHTGEEEIAFTQDSTEAIRDVKNGTYDLALLAPPTTVNEVKAVADEGLDMPPKSTFFYPKILTGLVFYRYV